MKGRRVACATRGLENMMTSECTKPAVTNAGVTSANELDREVGQLAWPIYRRSDIDTVVMGSGVANLLGTAIVRYMRADASMVRVEDPGAALPSTLTKADIDAACAGLDEVFVIEVTPDELHDALERRSALLELDESSCPRLVDTSNSDGVRTIRHAHFSGISCEVDLHKPSGERVTKLTMSNGDKLPGVLRLAVAAGGDACGSYRVVERCDRPLSSVVEAYVAKHSPVAVKAYGSTRYCW